MRDYFEDLYQEQKQKDQKKKRKQELLEMLNEFEYEEDQPK
jgi:hypothetical protein